MLSYKKVQCAVANAIQRITGFLLSFPYTPTLICVLNRYWNLTQFWKVSIVADWLANARWLTDIRVNITVIQNLCMFILLLVFSCQLRARHKMCLEYNLCLLLCWYTDVYLCTNIRTMTWGGETDGGSVPLPVAPLFSVWSIGRCGCFWFSRFVGWNY